MSCPAICGVRPVLTPARHAGVHETRVAVEQIVRSDAEPLGRAGPVDVDERIGIRGQRVHELATLRMLHVDRDRTLAAAHHRVDRRRLVDLGDAVDAHHVGAEAAEQHSAEGTRPESAHHHDADPGERSTHLLLHRSRGRGGLLRRVRDDLVAVLQFDRRGQV